MNRLNFQPWCLLTQNFQHICGMDIFAEELKQFVQALFSPTSSFAERRNSVHDMHQLFTSLGAINSLEEPGNLPDHLQLSSGRAIAPRQAGLCLLEPLRTRVFAEGLKDAVDDLLKQFPGKTIQVLDAGCGPYALLPLIAALYYHPQQVQFTVLDIFEENLSSAKTLINELGMGAYFSDFILTDATSWQWPGNDGPDIVISETMNKALEKEPQAAITLNLAAQLPAHGILLPQAVEVSLSKINAAEQNKCLTRVAAQGPDRSLFEEDLGSIFILDKATSVASDTLHPLCSKVIPGDYEEAVHKIQYSTAITVYKNHRLQWSDCSLTLPLNLEPYSNKTIRAGDVLGFYYAMRPVPGIGFDKVTQ